MHGFTWHGASLAREGFLNERGPFNHKSVASMLGAG